MKLLEKLKNLPDAPGVYQYFDKNGSLLYVGKAKSLKNRVKSYFRFSPKFMPAANLSPRIYKMVHEIYDLEYILVENENDALILENSLIKQLKPKYNILLRDDKTYPYIYIDLSQDFPRFEITRKVVKGKKIKYYGPFSVAAKDILDSIYEIFPLVQKKSCINGKKACLFYQMKRCLAPCEGKISKDEYKKVVEDAIKHILDKNLLIKKLESKMLDLSKNLRFEEAAIIRDRIEKIKKSNIQSNIDFAKLEDLDVLYIHEKKNEAVIIRIFMREGKVISSSSKIIKYDIDKGFDIDEAYKRAILDFYRNDSIFISKKIIVGKDFEQKGEIEELLRKKFKKNISIINPKKGEKVKLIKLAQINAKEILSKNQKNKNDEILYKIKELFDLKTTPFRIEIFDNSHIKGKQPVGAMVVYENEKLKKDDYRHYNLTSKDEYSQMKELLSKRADSFEKNPPPDLWVIDGGETLRKLAKDILKSVGVDIDVIAIAKEKADFKAVRSKGRARDIIYSEKEVFDLLPNDKRLQFIQYLRDEAHRFAIKFHKHQKIKHDKEISLLNATGIGEAKIKKLLNYFGSFENIKSATIEEIATVLNKKDAKNIKSFLSKN
ncbi:excinuclease ABC subunit UvrC [Nitrosophilus kaiyonis]|uniref:excinuclease ABC subunit UvrC n=1 Tax=Nitrosophilus kaiyonis TaxID=2930200 RepID=UPI0031E5CB10